MRRLDPDLRYDSILKHPAGTIFGGIQTGVDTATDLLGGAARVTAFWLGLVRWLGQSAIRLIRRDSTRCKPASGSRNGALSWILLLSVVFNN